MAWKHLPVIGLALLLAGCLNQANNKAADDATTQFYQRVSAKAYAAIYDDAATDLQLATPRDQFIAMMQRIDTVMGACQPPTKANTWASNINNGVVTRTQGYQRVCANGRLTEKVTMVIRDGKAKLAGFQFDSGAGGSSAATTNSVAAPPAANSLPAAATPTPVPAPAADNSALPGDLGAAVRAAPAGDSPRSPAPADDSAPASSGKDRGPSDDGDSNSKNF